MPQCIPVQGLGPPTCPGLRAPSVHPSWASDHAPLAEDSEPCGSPVNVTPASLPGSGATDSRRPYFRELGFLGPCRERSREVEVEVEGSRAQPGAWWGHFYRTATPRGLLGSLGLKGIWRCPRPPGALARRDGHASPSRWPCFSGNRRTSW